MMKDLVDTTQMYLKIIFELEEEGVVPLRARIAERLEQSGPTVSQTVARMERDGLLVVEPDRELLLTPKGRDIATAVMRKHRLAERLLVDVIGMDIADIHDEACRWEHVISESVERHLVQLLENPTVSPYGNPIPGLSRISSTSAAPRRFPRLTDVDLQQGQIVTLRVLGEVVQLDTDLVNKLTNSGIVPGTRVRVEEIGDTIRLRALGGEWITIPESLTHAICVEPVKR